MCRYSEQYYLFVVAEAAASAAQQVVMLAMSCMYLAQVDSRGRGLVASAISCTLLASSGV